VADAQRLKYWEIIANNLSKRGWSWGFSEHRDRDGRTIFCANANRGVRSDEKLAAFVEIEEQLRPLPSKV
jgi:hypothetical protein